MSATAARPKRAAEDYTRSHHDSDFNGQPSKKPRFDVRNPSALAPDALEEDAVLEADVIGKRGQQVRRNAVNVDGYDSDSDNENFDDRAEAKAKAKSAAERSKREEEADMFADLEEDFKDGDDSEGDAGRKGGSKKAVRFLDEDEIEGQVSNSKSGGHVSADFTLNNTQSSNNNKGKAKSTGVEDNEVDSSSDSEVDDETRADASNLLDEELGAGSKKTHAPKLDAFNMKTEQEEGRFDDQGNYVRKAADPDAIHDNWLEGLSKKDMKKAAEAHEKRERELQTKEQEDNARSTADILEKLIPLLESSETVLEALARLNKGKGKEKDKRKKWQKGKNKRKDNEDDEMEMDSVDSTEVKRKEAIETITGAADLLTSRIKLEIYDAVKEELIREYRRESGRDWVEPTAEVDADTKMWEYRWSDARDGGNIHGPYEATLMKQWNEAGYFGEGVEFRQQNSTEPWTRIAEFL